MNLIHGASPAQLKVAISVGIGLFIALIGLVDAGFVRRTPDSADSPVPVRFGIEGSLQGWPVLVFAIGLILMGTMTGIGAEADLLDEDGKPPNTQRILIVDSVAAAAGSAAGISSNTSYIESAAGVGEGARTGLASVVTGLLFLLATVFAPVVEIIPNEAAVPALILVGFLMMQQVKNIDWDDVEIALPAFLTIALMPFTYSISVGIGAGFIAFVLIKLVRGKASEIHPLMRVVALLFVAYFAIDPIKQVVGV